MNGNYLVKLTLALHREAESWKAGHLLKDKVEDLADDILTEYILETRGKEGVERGKLFQDIRGLLDCLVKARNEKIFERKSFLLFQKEYNRIRDELEREKTDFTHATARIEKVEKRKEEKTGKTEIIDKSGLNGRQGKILDILNAKQRVQVWELKEVFPGISKRTLRRDLDDLLKKDLVKRDGQWNEVFYCLP